MESVLLLSARASYLVVVFLLGVGGLALWVLAAAWVNRDAKARGLDPVAWTIAAAVLGPFGVGAWLAARERVAPLRRVQAERLVESVLPVACPECDNRFTVPRNGLSMAVLCPRCGAKVEARIALANGPK